jgi:hypothetical protein
MGRILFTTSVDSKAFESRKPLVTLMMDAANITEMSVNFYQTTHSKTPENSHRHCHKRIAINPLKPNLV